MARSTKKMSAHKAPIHASRVPLRLSQPLCAPYATTAGAVSERNPAITPIRNASSSTSDELIRRLLAMHRGRPFLPETCSGVKNGIRNAQLPSASMLSCEQVAGLLLRPPSLRPRARLFRTLRVVRRKPLAYTRLLTEPRRIAGAKPGSGAIRAVGGCDGRRDRARRCRRLLEARDSGCACAPLRAGLGARHRSAAISGI